MASNPANFDTALEAARNLGSWRSALELIRLIGRHYEFDETNDWCDALEQVEFDQQQTDVDAGEPRLFPLREGVPIIVDMTKGVDTSGRAQVWL